MDRPVNAAVAYGVGDDGRKDGRNPENEPDRLAKEQTTHQSSQPCDEANAGNEPVPALFDIGPQQAGPGVETDILAGAHVKVALPPPDQRRKLLGRVGVVIDRASVDLDDAIPGVADANTKLWFFVRIDVGVERSYLFQHRPFVSDRPAAMPHVGDLDVP